MDFLDEVTQTFNEYGDGNQFGNSHMTSLEFATMRRMWGRALIAERIAAPREVIKENIRRQIEEDGWLRPETKDIEGYIIGETGARHGCVVTESLAKERGEAASESTYFSYTTKNQFDRYMIKLMQAAGKYEKDFGLRKSFEETLIRTADHKNTNIKYPEGLDDTKIYGISKPSRFLPAQLMKNIELVRLSEDGAEHAIDWAEFFSVVKTSDTSVELASGIALKVIDIYVEREIALDVIITIIGDGMSPSGPIKEHGPIGEVFEIWVNIFNGLKSRTFQTDSGKKYQIILDRIKDYSNKKAQQAITWLNNEQGNEYALPRIEG